MKQNDDFNKTYDVLFEKFGKTLLSKREVSEVTGISISGLDRLRREGKGIEYKQINPNGTVYFSIVAIVDFILNNNTQIIETARKGI